jgi:hypothetical protein
MAGQLYAAETALAPLEEYDSGTVVTYVRSFDRATTEYANGSFKVPAALAAGTVTFKLGWIARVVPGSSEDVVWAFEHVAKADGEDIDAAYTQEKASADGTGTTQDGLVLTTWTETVDNLGWAADDVVHFRVLRVADDANDTFDNNGTQTNDDALMIHFSISIPRS